MAGNTKFVGFLNDNRVQLERWGTKATISLSPESIEALRAACFNDLPKNPSQRRMDHLADFDVEYDSQVGRVNANLDTEAAGYLADLLEVLVKDNVQAIDKVKPWIEELRAAVKAHKDFHDRNNEPGVTT